MKNISVGLLILMLIQVVTACSSARPIDDVVAQSDTWSQKTLSMRGYLCVEAIAAYLASTSVCSQAMELSSGGFQIHLTLTQAQFSSVEKYYKNVVPVVVTGIFRAPPAEAIRLERGVLPGYSILVSSIQIIEKEE